MELIPFWVRHRRRREREVSPWLSGYRRGLCPRPRRRQARHSPGNCRASGTRYIFARRRSSGSRRLSAGPLPSGALHRSSRGRTPARHARVVPMDRSGRSGRIEARSRSAVNGSRRIVTSTANRASSMGVHRMASARHSMARPGMRSRRSPMRSIARTPPIPEPQINRWHSRSARSKVVDRASPA